MASRVLSAAVLICCLLIISSGEAPGDVIHPAYLSMQEAEPGVFEVVWKVPLRYGMRLPVDPVFPSHCETLTSRTIEAFPSAQIERWRIDCGSGGLDRETIEIKGLDVTLIDAFVQIELLDGRVYDRLLRGASPRFVVEPRMSVFRIARGNAAFGLRHIIRKLPVILLVLAAFLYFGSSRKLMVALAAFAAGYTLSLFGSAFALVGTAAGWGSVAIGSSALSLSLGSLGKKEVSRIFASAVLFLCGILFGSGLGSEWAGDGLAYLDIPVAAVALLVGVFAGLILVAGLPALTQLVARDLKIDRIRVLRSVPVYAAGAMSVFLILYSIRGLVPAGIVQPYLRPESMLIALAGGFWLGISMRRHAFSAAACFIVTAAVGSAAGLVGLDLPFSAAGIPLSLALTGIAILFLPAARTSAVIIFSCIAGFYHGWINSSWLLEHVSTVLPGAAGGILLAAGIMVLGAVIRSSLSSESAVKWGRAGGAALLAWAFWMRLSGYSISEFREISVSAARGIHIPVLSLVLLAAGLVFIARGKKGSLFQATALLVLSLVLVPLGGFTIGGGPGSLADMNDEEAAVLIGGLLENTYRAVNLRGEDEIYDRLAMSIDGELVETIYLESRRRSVMPGQADTEAKLIGVRVLEVTGRSPAPEVSGYSFTTTWTVTGTVRHWAHKHNRLNRYNGIITIKAVDDLWKISGLELLDESRQM